MSTASYTTFEMSVFIEIYTQQVRAREVFVTFRCYDCISSGKVKVTFTLEQATKTQKWSRGIALFFL
jgi:hypothetical protein